MSAITCQICGASIHFVELHLEQKHSEMTLEGYVKKFPKAPIFSEEGEKRLAERASQWTGNAKVDFSIKDTFGVVGIGSETKNTVWGWQRPTNDVPTLDADYHFRESVLGVALYAINEPNEPTMLVGPTGSGKTSVFEQICARLNRPCFRINLDGDVTRSDLVGQWVLGGDNTMQFSYGVLPRAMKNGAVLIVDEIDCGAASVMMVVQAVLEGKPLSLLETGETIFPHPDFRILATANTNGMGDESGIYHGTQPQNYALFDRFTMVEKVDYPKERVELEILKKKTGVSDSHGVLTNAIKVANIVRKAHVKEEITATMSTRNLINLVRKIQIIGKVKRAYEVTFFNRLDAHDLDFVHGTVQRIWGV